MRSSIVLCFGAIATLAAAPAASANSLLPLAALPSLAQDDLFDEGDDVDEEASAPVDDEPIYGGEEVGSDTGGATGFVFPTGFHLASELGGHIRFGGYGDPGGGNCLRCEQKIVSNLQPWIGLTMGYDFIPELALQLTLGTGFVSDAAAVGGDEAYLQNLIDTGRVINNGNVSTDVKGRSALAENYAITTATVAVRGTWYPLGRLAVTGKGFVGGALLTPEPYPGAAGWGVSFGVGGGLRYATLLTDVIIGFDVNLYGVFSPDVVTGHIGGVGIGGLPIIPAFSFAPVIKYVF